MPRIQHPDWLHKKMLEKNDTLKQRKISEMFKASAKPAAQAQTASNSADRDLFDDNDSSGGVRDIEDMGSKRTPLQPKNATVSTKRKHDAVAEDLTRSWKEVLGNPPPRSQFKEWIAFQKKKWAYQLRQRTSSSKSGKKSRLGEEEDEDGDAARGGLGVVRAGGRIGTLGGFLKRAQRTLLDTPWQVIQIVETGQPGNFIVTL